MKIAEIRELPNEEINRELTEKRRALFNLRFQRETEQLERPAELRKLKKDIAAAADGAARTRTGRGRRRPAEGR